MMGYSSRGGRRPQENASKAAHSHVVNDPEVQAFLDRCIPPRRAGQIEFLDHLTVSHEKPARDPIEHIIAIDGGYTEVTVQEGFPAATLAFFQFGALFFSVKDLDEIEQQPFIDPDDMTRLRNIERLKLALPTRNLPLKSELSLVGSVRRSLYDFFGHKLDDGDRLLESLRWLIFEEYGPGVQQWALSSCPACGHTGVELRRVAMRVDHTFACPHCGEIIYLTDVLRLHERVDEELGAGGILGYVTTAVEQLILVHLIRLVLKTKPAMMSQLLFVKDGPLAFFGQTANLRRPMRALVRFLFDHHNLYLVGLEKSGPFVEHADQVSNLLTPGTALVLDNDYIHRYVVPGNAGSENAYGANTYYGTKIIFKASDGRLHVATLPTRYPSTHPSADDLVNLHLILDYLEKLRCDMYDNALVPIALANKLVSLANHPSAKILQRFAAGSIR